MMFLRGFVGAGVIVWAALLLPFATLWVGWEMSLRMARRPAISVGHMRARGDR